MNRPLRFWLRLAFAGAALAIAGVLWAREGSAGDANIGAGVLALAGASLFLAGFGMAASKRR